ncbi:255_t:CDS:2, partial [Acaulospora colombiana]
MASTSTNSQNIVRKCRRCGKLVEADDIFYPLACDSCWNFFDPETFILPYTNFRDSMEDLNNWEGMNPKEMLRQLRQNAQDTQPTASTSRVPVLPYRDPLEPLTQGWDPILYYFPNGVVGPMKE